MNIPAELQKWVDNGTLRPSFACDEELNFSIDAYHGKGKMYEVRCYDDGLVVIDEDDREHGPQEVFDGDADSADCWLGENVVE